MQPAPSVRAARTHWVGGEEAVVADGAGLIRDH
jgi:hypothetical protein